MLDIIRTLNEDKDRALLIGRNAFNFLLSDDREKNAFQTFDFDVVCPDLATANECKKILRSLGFEKKNGTFVGSKGELDIILSDPEHPAEIVVSGFYNLPSLRPLWESRKKHDGVLLPDIDAIIWNKLLYSRENEGKDTETVSIYFELHPERFEPFLRKVDSHPNTEEKETILFALYASTEERPEQKSLIEDVVRENIVRSRSARLPK